MSAPTHTTDTSKRPKAATTVGGLAVLGCLGSAAMTVAHLGIELPLLGGGVTLVPVAAGFAVGTLVFAATAYGAFTLQSWAWPVALVINALALASTSSPLSRGDIEPVTVGAVAASLLSLIVLVSRPGRQALLYRSAPRE